jgi:uncharacterized integral membrane protein (TIGR00698 family)
MMVDRQAGRIALFIALAGLCVWPRVDAAMALTGGMLFSMTLGNPSPRVTARCSKRLLQLSVVGLGFGMGIGQVLQEGKDSIVLTIVSITLTLSAGWLIGRLLRVDATTSRLIAFGTAICGGSAIAAMAPVLKAEDDEIAVSLATVFALNSIALLVFPPVGHLFHLDQHAFGLWAALAIHDTSSVVGAASTFGAAALVTATTVKLTRALWITPCVFGAALFGGSGKRATIPLFIIGFIGAALIRSRFPGEAVLWNELALSAQRLLVVTLFFIGAGLTREVLRTVGLRPLLQGVSLWLLVSVATLAAIMGGLA